MVETETETETETEVKRARLKKCVKCGQKKSLECFGSHSDTADGRQSYCLDCKRELGRVRHRNNVAARLKHHTATRVHDQLGSLCPPKLVTRLEFLIGYRFERLAKVLRAKLAVDFPDKKLRDVLEESWHVDHIHPLKEYRVIQNGEVDWNEFRRCWALTNLQVIPALDNLKKGSKIASDDPVQTTTNDST